MWKLITLIFLYVLFTIDAFAMDHRSSEDEGWAWASSLKYSFKTSAGPPLDFKKTHEEMRDQQVLLKSAISLDPKKNICLVRFSFVIEKLDGTAPELVPLSSFFTESLGSIDQHVFISGEEFPPDSSMKKDRKKEPIPNPCDGYLMSVKNNKVGAEGKIFIHPADHFSPMQYVIGRLNQRYEGVSDEGLQSLVMPRLAREWMKIEEYRNSEGILNWFKYVWKQFKGEESSDKAVIDWFLNANNPSPHSGTGEDVGGNSCAVFFTHNEDSEQKLLHYLNDITDHIDEAMFFKKLLEDIKRFVKVNRNVSYLSKKIRDMIELEKAEESKCRDNISNIIATQSTHSYPELQNIIDTFIKRLKTSTNIYTYNVEQLLEFAATIKTTLDDFISSKMMKVDETIETLEDISKNEVLKVDKLVIDFEDAVVKCGQQHQGYVISAIILNIHNTFDSCYSCAPDLAQESVRENGFVSYFQSVVKKHNPDYSVPFFRIVASCGKRRDGKWCTQCKEIKYADPVLISPIGEKIKYYQHELPEDTSNALGQPGNKGPEMDYELMTSQVAIKITSGVNKTNEKSKRSKEKNKKEESSTSS